MHSILSLFGNGRNMNGRICSKSERNGRTGVTNLKKIYYFLKMGVLCPPQAEIFRILSSKLSFHIQLPTNFGDFPFRIPFDGYDQMGGMVGKRMVGL